jgi:hypothetical protein
METTPDHGAVTANWSGKVREIDGCQFLTIVFINNDLTFLEGTRVKIFETLRDRATICQQLHDRLPRKPDPARVDMSARTMCYLRKLGKMATAVVRGEFYCRSQVRHFDRIEVLG